MSPPWMFLLVAVLGASCVQSLIQTDFNVISYNLTLSVVNITAPVAGWNNISLNCLRPTSSIVLNWGFSLSFPYKENFTIQYQADSAAGGELSTVTVINVDFENSVVNITTTPTVEGATTFAKGSSVYVSVYFNAAINKEQKGLFGRQYASGAVTNSLIASAMRPSYAREVFPCLDDPSYPALFNITLSRPSSWVAATSLFLNQTHTDETSKITTDTFNSTTPLPPHALSIFLSSEMKSTNKTDIYMSNTTVTFWTPQSFNLAIGSNHLQLLTYYFYQVERLIGTFFDRRQLHVVFVPGLAAPFGGYGVVFVRNDTYNTDYTISQNEGVFKDQVVPVVNQLLKQFTEFSTRPNSWADYWMADSFATYLQYLLLASIQKPYDFRTELDVTCRQKALSLDSPNSRPLEDNTIDTNSPTDVEASITDPLKGLKGASLLSMLDYSFPEGIVLSAIKAFLTINQGRSVTSADFYSLLATSVSATQLSYNAKVALDNVGYWFNSTRYPLIDVTINAYGPSGSLNLTMLPFCAYPQPCTDPLPLWYSSVAVGSTAEPRAGRPRQDVWLGSHLTTTAVLNISADGWVIANEQAAGYYRSNYTLANWARLTKDLQAPGRSQLIDDAFALSSTGQLGYNVTLRLATSNTAATQYSDWLPVQRGLAGIGDLLRGTAVEQDYKNFTTPFLLDVDYLLKSKTLNSFDQARIYSLFLDLMCEFDIGGTRNTSVSVLLALLNGEFPATVPSSAYHPAVCCASLYNASLDAQHLWDSLTDSDAGYYKRQFNAVAFGCFYDVTKITNVLSLNLIANDNLVPKDFALVTALSYMAEKRPMELLTILSQNPVKLQNLLGSTNMATIVTKIGSKINNGNQSVLGQLKQISTAKGVDKVVSSAATTSVTDATNRILHLLSTQMYELSSALKGDTIPFVATSVAPTVSSSAAPTVTPTVPPSKGSANAHLVPVFCLVSSLIYVILVGKLHTC